MSVGDVDRSVLCELGEEFVRRFDGVSFEVSGSGPWTLFVDKFGVGECRLVFHLGRICVIFDDQVLPDQVVSVFDEDFVEQLVGILGRLGF